MPEARKSIEVVAAVIRRDGLVFAARRDGRGEAAHRWEFPGGKLEPGEGRREALARELREELGLEATVGDFIMSIAHAYAGFDLNLHCYELAQCRGEPVLHEHVEARWLPVEALGSLDWAPADLPLVARLQADAQAAAKKRGDGSTPGL